MEIISLNRLNEEGFKTGDMYTKTTSSRRKYVGWFVGTLLLAVLLVTGCGNKEGEGSNLDEANPLDVSATNEAPKPIGVGNDGVKAGIAPDNSDGIEIVSSGSTSDRMVMLTIPSIGRTDPFLPDAGGTDALGSYITSDMVLPPENITPSPNAESVITTKVTGILYDQYNPSAIINIEGSDYLVRSGDLIHNYKVLSIAKNNVAVQLGANVYKAGVGEIFTPDKLNYNTISNLNSKFGSPKNKK